MPASRLSADLARIARDDAFRNSLGEGAYVLDEQGRLQAPNPRPSVCSAGAPTSSAAATCTRPSTTCVRTARASRRRSARSLGVLRSGVDFGETHDVFVRKDGTMLPAAHVSSPVLLDEEIVGVLAFWQR